MEYNEKKNQLTTLEIERAERLQSEKKDIENMDSNWALCYLCNVDSSCSILLLI